MIFEGGVSFEYLTEAQYDMVEFITERANHIAAEKQRALPK